MKQVEIGAGDAEGLRVVPGPSLGIRRSFCGDGGTPLSYEAERLPSEVYDMVASLDNPEPFEPETHARVSQKPEWLYQSDSIQGTNCHGTGRAGYPSNAPGRGVEGGRRRPVELRGICAIILRHF